MAAYRRVYDYRYLFAPKTARGSGERCKLPSGVKAKPQPTNDLVHIGFKSAALMAAVLLIFLRTNVIFCTKTSLISYGGSNSSHVGAL